MIQAATITLWQKVAGIPSVHPYDGTAIALATTATFLSINPLVAGLILLASGRIKTYLGLYPASPGKIALWLLLISALMLAFAGLNWFLDRPTPDFMQVAMETADPLVLLIFALVIAAPVTEEVVFRGFVYRGLAESRLGPIAAIVVSTLIFTLIHVQYESLDLLYVGLLGLALGIARWHTGSLLTPILMHALANLIATLDVLLFMQG